MARVVLAGYLVRNPLGGYVWQAGHYLLGLRALGHDAWFYEDTGHFALAYNPLTNDYGPRYEHGLAAAADFLRRIGFAAAGFSSASGGAVGTGPGRGGGPASCPGGTLWSTVPGATLTPPGGATGCRRAITE